MRLPARLQPDHVAGDLHRAQRARRFQHQRLVRAGEGAELQAQAPQWRHRAATREKVVAFHRFAHGRPGEDIHVHPGGIAGQIEDHLRVPASGPGGDTAPPRRSWALGAVSFARRGLIGRQSGHVHDGHPGSINVNAVALGAQIERDRAVAGPGFAPPPPRKQSGSCTSPFAGKPPGPGRSHRSPRRVPRTAHKPSCARTNPAADLARLERQRRRRRQSSKP